MTMPPLVAPSDPDFRGWGCICEEDAKTNNEAVRAGFRILSAYPIDESKPCKGYGDNTLWITRRPTAA